MSDNSQSKILILSYYFAPGNLMGAVRPTKLAKYLSREGYNVSVVSSIENKWLFLNNKVKIDEILLQDSKELNIFRPSHSWLFIFLSSIVRFLMNRILVPNKNSIKISDNGNNYKLNFKYKFIKNSMFFMSLLQDIDFTISAFFSKRVRVLAKESSHVISTYGPYSSHFLGFVLKNVFNNNLYWIADFRDPIAQPTDTKFQFKINKWIENRVCEKADRIVSVSDGYSESIVSSRYLYKSSIITNGFDREDLLNVSFKDEYKDNKKDKFIISYTGTTYGGRRDLKPLFSVFKELILDENFFSDRLEFHYAGPESDLISQLARVFGISKIVFTHGILTRNDALILNYNSSLIVVATWNDKDHLGVLPGKFFESLLFNKPLIVLVNCIIGNSEIKRITNAYNLGVTYESVSHDFDYIALKEFITERVVYFNQRSYDNNFLIDKFDYKNIAIEYSKLF
jgi:hypothetical protein